jgi:hypothetical protein
MCANNHISPIWPHGTSIRIPRQGLAHIYKWYQARGVGQDQNSTLRSRRKERKGGKRTESILFVFATRTESETAIILAHPAIDAIP